MVRARVLQTFWQPRFPDQIPDDNPVADPLDGPSFELEGHRLVAVDVGHTDTDDTRSGPAVSARPARG